MLIQPWDAAVHEGEWQGWLAEGRDFGQLVVNGPAGQPPLALPTHFLLAGDQVLMHFARANRVWHAVQAAPTVVISVADDYTYVPASWRARDDEPVEHGVPTAYYAAVQLTGQAEIVDDPEQKAELLRRQLAHHQPDGGHSPLRADGPPYGKHLSALRGMRVHVTSVAAKFKYDDHRPEEQRLRISHRLVDRGGPRDAAAARQQLRRLDEARDRRSRDLDGTA